MLLEFGLLVMNQIIVFNTFFFDKMSLFNEKLKKITLKELLSLIILLFLIQYFLNTLNIVHIETFWIYVIVILYFIFKLKPNLNGNFDYFSDIFTKNNLKHVLMIVILNIFISYGFLYLSNEILNIIPSLNLMPNIGMSSNSIINLGLVATIVVSPIAEELIFRGVFLNRLQLIVPPLFAVLVSSLLFASLHSFGSITSAFIFGICMAILYLKTDNILVPIFAHFLNNFFAQIIFILDSNKILFTNEVVVMMSVLAIISFVLIFYSIIVELKYINNNKLQ